MSGARILQFRQAKNATTPPIAEAQSGRFMIVGNLDILNDHLGAGLPDDVFAFGLRRLALKAQLGRALSDDEAAYRLHKHVRVVQRYRDDYGDFLAFMEGLSGHARAKLAGKSSNFSGKKFAKSSTKKWSKPQENCQSATPDSIEGETLSPIGRERESLPQTAPLNGARDAGGTRAPPQRSSKGSKQAPPKAPPPPDDEPDEALQLLCDTLQIEHDQHLWRCGPGFVYCSICDARVEFGGRAPNRPCRPHQFDDVKLKDCLAANERLMARIGKEHEPVDDALQRLADKLNVTHPQHWWSRASGEVYCSGCEIMVSLDQTPPPLDGPCRLKYKPSSRKQREANKRKHQEAAAQRVAARSAAPPPPRADLAALERDR